MGKLPVVFFGHGSPMNAIANNRFTQGYKSIAQKIGRPKSILMISAHWMTKGTYVTSMASPKTIHDFYGFPDELFKVQYNAPGSPSLAKDVQALVPSIGADSSEWGLDHGTWSVLIHAFPQADIPVVQLSLDMSQPPQYHFDLGQKLKPLREKGVLIAASGNIVHNLRRINWDSDAKPYEWAVEFDEWFKERSVAKDFAPLVNDFTKAEAGRLSVPTPDHYLPLLYILGASDSADKIEFDVEGIQNASISMRSLRFTP